MGQTGRLRSDAFEKVVDERVHDAHSLGGDTSVGVDLLQYLVDVDSIGLLALPLRFLLGAIFVDLSRRPSSLLDGLAGNFGSHVSRKTKG